jgi:hypothetical protein
MHHQQSCIVGALKICPQILIRACPGEGEDWWLGFYSGQESILFCPKEKKIDPKWFVGSGSDIANLCPYLRRGQPRNAQGPKATSLRHGDD